MPHVMRKLNIAFFGVGSAVMACGGRLDDGGITGQLDSGIDAADTSADTASVDTIAKPETDGASPLCQLSDGTPTCDVAGCPVRAGCTHLGSECILFGNETSASGVSPFGVCFKDAKKVFTYGTCTVCPNADDVCTVFAPYDLYNASCARPTICRDLEVAGFTGACLYTDKTKWSAEDPAIGDPGCPAGGRAAGLCGGSCGDCAGSEKCTGRSPLHPFGVCAALPDLSTNPFPCKRNPKSSSEKCEAGACVIFDVQGKGDQNVADANGFCLANDRCIAARTLLPGAIHCMSGSGSEI